MLHAKRIMAWSTGVCIVVIGTTASQAQTRFHLEPRSSTSAFSIVGNEIRTQPGSIVDLEIRLTGWGQVAGSPSLGAAGATMYPDSYLGVNAEPPNPGVDLLPLGYALPDPNGGTRLEGLFGIITICSISGRDCTAGQAPSCDHATEGICLENPLALCSGYAPFPVFERTSLSNYFAGQVCIPPGGRPTEPTELGHGHIGKLRLVVPENAEGTYTIAFNPHPDLTLVNNGLGLPMAGTLTLDTARITLIPGFVAPAQSAPAPHDIAKNRYIAFAPAQGGASTAYQVRLASSLFNPGAVGTTGWVGAPSAAFFPASPVVTAPVFRVWNEPVLNVGDCEIQPGATYEIRSTLDGVTFSEPLTVSTVDKPSLKDWGDVAGVNNGVEWTPPNGLANVNDILAIRSLITFSDPFISFYRANLQASSTNDSCLNTVVNTADTFAAILAVNGQPYPFTTDPSQCQPCP